jgi:hypothetical protein
MDICDGAHVLGFTACLQGVGSDIRHAVMSVIFAEKVSKKISTIPMQWRVNEIEDPSQPLRAIKCGFHYTDWGWKAIKCVLYHTDWEVLWREMPRGLSIASKKV